MTTEQIDVAFEAAWKRMRDDNPLPTEFKYVEPLIKASCRGGFVDGVRYGFDYAMDETKKLMGAK